MNYSSTIILGVLLVAALVAVIYFQGRQFPVPSGETKPLIDAGEEQQQRTAPASEEGGDSRVVRKETTGEEDAARSQREILVTDGVKHSVPLNEILSGGPGKDGIPSIDNPKFLSAGDAAFLNESDVGLGLIVEGESRFYPYRILVWHEIVNDTIAGEPVLVTYCPLCATGIVFERRIDGNVEEFGVSGRLWQSNLLMYNRSADKDEESLWSQVLGEAVLGAHTGKKLPIVRSDVVRWGGWKTAHPDTRVLSRDTGAARDYGRDPYGNYYTSNSVSFGATFSDTRLHPKALVHGIEIDGAYKAYEADALPERTTDAFAGREIVITKNDIGQVTFTADEEQISSIPSFWFSWLAVHPETELWVGR